MSTFDMLDAAIGLVFIFLLLSLICTALNEIIENFLKRRATDLEKGIRELLLPNQAEDTQQVMQQFYKHPIITSLYKGKYIPGSRNLPSYIPASNFSHALLDIILPASPTNLSGAAGGGTPTPVGAVAPPATDPQPMKSLDPLRNAVLAWPASDARTAIAALIDAAGNDMDKARSNVENWFNSSMDRVSGWYKRRLQLILLLLGFLVAIAMNADTIAIAKSLLNDTPVRNSLVAAAQEYAKPNTTVTDTTKPVDRVDENAKKLYDLRLPIGWDWNEDTTVKNKAAIDYYKTNYARAIPWANGAAGNDLTVHWFLKILGWMLTALAVSLGSSFWFDTLNKIMVVRSTVKPHEKSPEEASEDKQPKKQKTTYT